MNDDGKPLTFWRALWQPEFWLLLVAAFAAACGLNWWVALPLAVAGLSIASLPKYMELWPRAKAVGAEWHWWMTVSLSLFNNVAAGAAAVLFGKVTQWLWW